MRIPTGLFARNFLAYIEQNTERIFWGNQRIVTGRRIQRPSDDPSGASTAIKLRHNIGTNDQYIENTHDGIAWLNSTEVACNHIVELLTRVSELATTGANETLTPQERRTIGDEVNEFLEELVDVANIQVKGKYIFAGFQTLDPAYGVTRVGGLITDVFPNPVGIDGEIQRKISEAEAVTINLSGNQIFNLSGGIDTFDVLINLRDALYADNTPGIITAITQLEEAIQTARAGIEIIGARTERLTAHIPVLEEMQIARTAELSGIEDTDMAYEAVELQKNQTILEAALQIGRRIMQLSIFSFLR